MVAALLLWVAAAAAPAGVAPEKVVGVWQMCYAPGLRGVSEIDHAFLVLQPGGRYVMTRAGLDEPASTETGSYTRTADGVVLHPERRLYPDGKPSPAHVFRPTTLRLRGERRVVLWPEKDRVRRLPVLSSHESTNYSWAKVL